jgi:hypothetical protein
MDIVFVQDGIRWVFIDRPIGMPTNHYCIGAIVFQQSFLFGNKSNRQKIGWNNMSVHIVIYEPCLFLFIYMYVIIRPDI